MSKARVAIIDYGMGNLFSVQRACELAGLAPVLAASPEELEGAQGLILPGVGAFGEAMAELERRGLAAALRKAAGDSIPLFGICLGLQLLMEESLEFGSHRGLGIVPGRVVRLTGGERALKVPQVGWNRISAARPWTGTPLSSVASGDFMYFVHSFRVVPADERATLSHTTYGTEKFCSSLQVGEIFACQFHPERSGPIGLKVYRDWAATLSTKVPS